MKNDRKLRKTQKKLWINNELTKRITEIYAFH